MGCSVQDIDPWPHSSWLAFCSPSRMILDHDGPCRQIMVNHDSLPYNRWFSHHPQCLIACRGWIATWGDHMRPPSLRRGGIRIEPALMLSTEDYYELTWPNYLYPLLTMNHSQPYGHVHHDQCWPQRGCSQGQDWFSTTVISPWLDGLVNNESIWIASLFFWLNACQLLSQLLCTAVFPDRDDFGQFTKLYIAALSHHKYWY